MFAGLGFILTFFQYESPRFLVKQGKVDEATAVLAKLRRQDPSSEYITSHIAETQMALNDELEASQGVGWAGKLKEMFLDKTNLYRFYLTTMVQFLAPWSGAGSITLYAPDLFAIIGIGGSEEGLLVTGVFGIVKLVASIVCALFLVDVIGRKRALLIGIALQTISMIYVAAFLTAIPELGVVDGFVLPQSQKAASTGAIAMIYISGFGWALGWNSMIYLLTAELFPLRIRALASSWAMTLHFANQYGNSRAVPNMLLPVADGGISPGGTFWCCAAITFVGGVWAWIFIPETSGRSLESMDRLFELPWYRIGLYGNRDADEKEMVHDEKQRAAEEERAQESRVEKRPGEV